MLLELKRVGTEGYVPGCLSDQSYDSDLLFVDFEDRVRLYNFGELGLLAHVDVAGEHWEVDPLAVFDQIWNSFVEFMIADTRCLVAHAAQNCGFTEAVVDVEEQRSLEAIACIEQNDVLFFGSRLLDYSSDFRETAIRLALDWRGIRMGMNIVRVKNRERERLLRNADARKKNRRQSGNETHGPSLSRSVLTRGNLAQ